MADEAQLPPLNDRQELFCREYVIDFNGTKAAIRAGYSVDSAKEIASENLTKLNIATRIEELKKDIFAAVGITQARVYRELSRLAFVDISGIFGEDGALKALKDIDEDTRAAIAGIEIDELFEGVGRDRMQIGVTKKIKLSDKLNALAQLVKIGGWNAPTKTELTGTDGGPIQITGMEIK